MIFAASLEDTVTVQFVGGDKLTGVVFHVPQAPGDSWVIHLADGTIYHIQSFETMRVENRKAE